MYLFLNVSVKKTAKFHEKILFDNGVISLLPVEHRITFKLCMLMHLIHIGRAPRYMADSVQSIVESSCRPGLRSADTADYVKHRLQSKLGERCFSYAGPAAWNSLPHSIKLVTDTTLHNTLHYIAFKLFRVA